MTMSSNPTPAEYQQSRNRGGLPNLYTDGLLSIIDHLPGTQPDTHVNAPVVVCIGGPQSPDVDPRQRSGAKTGQVYFVLEGDARYVHGMGLVLQIPDAVAEALRQQGRRSLQREIAATLGIVQS